MASRDPLDQSQLESIIENPGRWFAEGRTMPGFSLRVHCRLKLGLHNTNPSSGREDDLNPGLPDYKSSALTTRPRYSTSIKLYSYFTFLQ